MLVSEARFYHLENTLIEIEIWIGAAADYPRSRLPEKIWLDSQPFILVVAMEIFFFNQDFAVLRELFTLLIYYPSFLVLLLSFSRLCRLAFRPPSKFVRRSEKEGGADETPTSTTHHVEEQTVGIDPPPPPKKKKKKKKNR